MPDPSNLIVFPIAGLLITVLTYILAKNFQSSVLLMASISYVYFTEISFMYALFVLYLSSEASVFSYNETSSVKVFIDFFTIYQIGVILYIKSTDSLTAQPYQNYLSQLNKIQIRLESDDWDGLKFLYESYKDNRTNYFFIKSIEKHHDETYAKLNQIIIQKILHDALDRSEAFKTMFLNDFKIHLHSQIGIYEDVLENRSSQWSSSLFLRYYQVPRLIFSKVIKILGNKKFFNRLFHVMVVYKLVIINIIIMLTFIITYCYFKVNLFYY